MRRVPLTQPEPSLAAAVSDTCELVSNAQHLDRVVRQGMMRARVSLEIMTADLKAMLIPDPGTRNASSIIDVLASLALGGVEVRVLHAGVPSSAALADLRSLAKRGLPSNLSFRRCPRVHAKVVVVDAASMYMGSANLTGAGLGAKGKSRRNFEMGLWTRATPLIDATLDQFNALWEGHECETCGRRDVCPEPLEEPIF